MMEVLTSARGGLPVGRRSFLRGGLACGLVAAGISAADPLLAAESLRCRHVVFDSRIEASANFARMAQARGAETLDIAAGLTRTWRDHLIPHWQSDGGPVIGLTTRTVWDCLAIQSRDHFRRPRLLGLHTPEIGKPEGERPLHYGRGGKSLRLSASPLLAHWTIG